MDTQLLARPLLLRSSDRPIELAVLEANDFAPTEKFHHGGSSSYGWQDETNGIKETDKEQL